MSIQDRNRYKKEIDILIHRLSILQWQEKEYKELWEEIGEYKDIIVGLKDNISTLDSTIVHRDALIVDLDRKNKVTRWEGKQVEKDYKKLQKKADKEREDYIKQKDIFNHHIDKKQETLNKINVKITKAQDDMGQAQKEHREYIDKIRDEKWDLLDKVLNNDTILKEQEDKLNKLKKKKDGVQEDYNALDKEYQKLLEDYIIKQ